MAKLVRCPCCKKSKREDEYYKNSYRSTGRAAHCKKCVVAKQTARYTKDEIKLKNRKHKLKIQYGLTIEDYEKMCQEQDHQCFICKERVRLVVDHNHTTGKVRKLLCHNCNAGLGHFRENPVFLDAAKEYVLSQN